MVVRGVLRWARVFAGDAGNRMVRSTFRCPREGGRCLGLASYQADKSAGKGAMHTAPCPQDSTRHGGEQGDACERRDALH